MTEWLGCRFEVEGDPKGQPRPRAFARNGVARVYDPGTAEGWKGAIALAARPHRPPVPFGEALRLTADFRFHRPRRLDSRKNAGRHFIHVSKPDLDNALKAVMDCLCELRFFRDDAQIAEIYAAKSYATTGGNVGAIIGLEPCSLIRIGGVEYEVRPVTVQDAADLICGPGARIEGIEP